MNEELKEKEKKLIESTIESLLKEWEMYADSISPKNLEYIESLSKAICKFSNKLMGKNKPIKGENDPVKDSNVDNAMIDAIDEYSAYMGYKHDYIKTKNSEYIPMLEQEFGHMIDNLKIALEEIDSITKEDDSEQSTKERDMLKAFAKWTYQMFS